MWSNFKDLKLGRFAGTFVRNNDGSFEGGFDLPNEFRLKGLYVDYRHFYSQKERINLDKFTNYLASLTDSIDFKKFLKTEKKKVSTIYEDNGFFRYKNETVSSTKLIDIFFNAEIFHSDKVKSLTLSKYHSILENKTASSMLFIAVYDSILVLKILIGQYLN